MIHHYTHSDMHPTGKTLLMKRCAKYKDVMVGSSFCTKRCAYKLTVDGTKDVFCMREENEYLLLDIMHLVETLQTN